MPDKSLEAKETVKVIKPATKNAVKIPELVYHCLIVDKSEAVETEPMEKQSEPNIVQKPSDALNRTNSDVDTSFKDPPPSMSKCVGTSVGRNNSVMHRPECWSGEVTCEEWLRHEYAVFSPWMHYSEFNKMLHISHTT